MTAPVHGPPIFLGPLPTGWRSTTIDEGTVRAPLDRIFEIAADVERWPLHLMHYRYVRFLDRRRDGGGVVEMSANRPFGFLQWRTWWTSEMEVVRPDAFHPVRPSIRFRHVRGITTGMEVEWQFTPADDGRATAVRIVHVWNGPRWPLIGLTAARLVIGPIFVHGIASRTLSGLATAAESSGRHGPGRSTLRGNERF